MFDKYIEDEAGHLTQSIKSGVITPYFVAFLRTQFRLDWKGIHWISHWSRVRHNGLRIAKENGADKRVIEYFALLHVSQRNCDGHDSDHGRRAADLASTLGDTHIAVDDQSFYQLTTACQGHTHESFHEDVTIQTYWDTDRLDLCPVGVTPDPERMGTQKGKEMASQLTNTVWM